MVTPACPSTGYGKGVFATNPMPHTETFNALRVQAARPKGNAPEGEPLTAKEIELLKRWVAEGAEYKQHWAWIPPARPAIPEVAGSIRSVCPLCVSRLRLPRRIRMTSW